MEARCFSDGSKAIERNPLYFAPPRVCALYKIHSSMMSMRMGAYLYHGIKEVLFIGVGEQEQARRSGPGSYIWCGASLFSPQIHRESFVITGRLPIHPPCPLCVEVWFSSGLHGQQNGPRTLSFRRSVRIPVSGHTHTHVLRWSGEVNPRVRGGRTCSFFVPLSWLQ